MMISTRLVSLDKHNNLILRINGIWYTHSEAERRATRADRIQVDRLRQQAEQQLPLYDDDGFYWPDMPSHRWEEEDIVADLVLVFAFSEEQAATICETSRLMAKIKASIAD